MECKVSGDETKELCVCVLERQKTNYNLMKCKKQTSRFLQNSVIQGSVNIENPETFHYHFLFRLVW